MTIAAVLNKKKDDIYASLNQNKIEEARLKVLELLDSEELKDNKDVPKAKDIFTKCKGKTNLFLSTLMTYMTCLKV